MGHKSDRNDIFCLSLHCHSLYVECVLLHEFSYFVVVVLFNIVLFLWIFHLLLHHHLWHHVSLIWALWPRAFVEGWQKPSLTVCLRLDWIWVTHHSYARARVHIARQTHRSALLFPCHKTQNRDAVIVIACRRLGEPAFVHSCDTLRFMYWMHSCCLYWQTSTCQPYCTISHTDTSHTITHRFKFKWRISRSSDRHLISSDRCKNFYSFI